MLKLESEHYVFHYNAGTYAEQEIEKIARMQEACFQFICEVLKTTPPFKIQYYLCDSPEEVGHIYGDDDPCNGFTAPPDKIYAVYNEKVRCIGFHEDAHLISYVINRPDSPAIREGLAMFFDQSWWGIHNMEWAFFLLKSGKFVSIEKLLDKEYFFSVDCAISYPIMGAFTQWLITVYGVDPYIDFYKQPDPTAAIPLCFHRSLQELERSFTNYIRLFGTDRAVEDRMAELLAKLDIGDSGK